MLSEVPEIKNIILKTHILFEKIAIYTLPIDTDSEITRSSSEFLGAEFEDILIDLANTSPEYLNAAFAA